MASQGEDSLGSVPIPDIAAIQDHLLQNGQPSADAQTLRPRSEAHTNDESHLPSTQSQPIGDEVIESVDIAPFPLPNAFAQAPRLTPSKSAPSDMDAMVNHNALQEATMIRPNSFHGYFGGDTQPMESQVYRDYTESITKSSGTTPKKTILRLDEHKQKDENTYNTASANERTQHTMDQGDSGFVDLDMAWQRDDSPTAKSTTSGIEELLAGPETQSQSNGYANGGFAPRTPGLTGDRRRRSGDVPTSATDTSRKTQTPRFSQLFGDTSNFPALSATQLFDQTQAVSSPMVNAARSDPVADRPSPNANASPELMGSSPVVMMHNPPASTAGEPRETYTSMRESQERRAARLRQDLELQNRFGPGAISELDVEDDDDTQQARLNRKRLHRAMSDQAFEECSKYRAPSRPGARSSDRKHATTIDLVTPGTSRRPGRVQFDLLDDDQETDVDEEMDVDLPVEAEDAHDGEGIPEIDGAEDYDENNDVYDEYSQMVMRSQRDPEDEDEEPHVQDRNDDDFLDNVPADEPKGDGDEEEKTDEAEDNTGIHEVDTEIREADDGTPSEGAPGTQPAVADSQPERLKAQRSLLFKDSNGQTVTSSIIPGSQYAGTPSQEVAQHSSRVPNSSTKSQGHRKESSKGRIEETRVPSSPPIPAVDNAGDGDDLEVTEVPQEPSDRSRREIPESDQPDHGNIESAKEDTAFESAQESNFAAPFSTAQTHLEESAHTPGKPRLVKELSKVSVSEQPSQQSMPTPLKAAGVRRFADIAADPSPPGYGGDSQLDMDAIMGNVISMDDQNFMDVLSSPPSEKPTKRRRLLQKESSRRGSRLPGMEIAGSEPATESVRASSPTKMVEEEEISHPVAFTAPVPAVESLRSSPAKSTEAPSATPEEPNAPDTPESVRMREAAGSKAASQLLSARSVPTTTASKAKGGKIGRKTSTSRQSKAKPSASRSNLETVVETTNSEVSSKTGTGTSDSSEAVASDNNEAPATTATAIPVHDLAFDAPDRVLALFRRASYNAYYPATWLSTNPDGKSHQVRFDDTTIETIELVHMRALEFKVDDAIKVDFEGFRSKTWIVKAFGRKAQDDEDRANGVDVHGHVTLRVQAKVTQRNSMPAPDVAAQAEGDIREIMVTNVKITHNMITPFADRGFNPPDGKAAANAANGTPLNKEQSADLETPSRSRRAAASTLKSATREQSKLREESVASSSDVASAGMFEGMAFAVTYYANENEKYDVTRLIRRNGGLILEQGFDELFVAPQLDDPATPSKRSGKKTAVATSDPELGSLQLKPEYEKLGFIALIADKHSRRAKYMQALALDIPTLSGRWVMDSVDASRNAALPLSPRPWTRYLLPSGESSYLGGAIRSRTLQYYNPGSTKLSETISSRAQLLAGAGVLLVAPKKGKGSWERRKVYAFLTLALGAGSVRRVADLAEAKKLLASDAGKLKWTWVYVDEDVGEAAKVLFGAKGAGTGRKRKRNEGPQMCVEGMQGRVKIVGDEFVVQSLILGALVD